MYFFFNFFIRFNIYLIIFFFKSLWGNTQGHSFFKALFKWSLKWCPISDSSFVQFPVTIILLYLPSLICIQLNLIWGFLLWWILFTYALEYATVFVCFFHCILFSHTLVSCKNSLYIYILGENIHPHLSSVLSLVVLTLITLKLFWLQSHGIG